MNEADLLVSKLFLLTTSLILFTISYTSVTELSYELHGIGSVTGLSGSPMLRAPGHDVKWNFQESQ